MDTSDRDRKVRDLAAHQFGAISQRQLTEIGLSYSSIKVRERRGQLTRVQRNVFVAGPSDEYWEQKVMIAILDGGRGTCATGTSALRLLGVSECERLDDITTCRIRQRNHEPPGFRRKIKHPGWKMVGPVPVVNAERALLDLAAGPHRRLIITSMAACVDLGITDLTSLQRWLKQTRKRGRTGISLFRRALAAQDPQDQSVLETRFADLLAQSSLPEPVPQFEVRAGSKRYRLDFAWPRSMVGVELDSRAFHTGIEVFESDRARQNELVLSNWTLLRFTWRQLAQQPLHVLRILEKALGR